MVTDSIPIHEMAHNRTDLVVERLPNFIIAGASRCGTSSLHASLRAHPDVFVPAMKELHFFDRDANYDGRSTTYSRHFRDWAGQSAIGEATPGYWLRGMTFDSRGHHQFCLHDDAGSRLSAMLPQVKTIISLRAPVNRAYSQYCRNRRLGRETAATFLEALDEEKRGDRRPEQNRMCWIYHNRYMFHLKRWFELFDRKQVRVLIFEQWIKRPHKLFHELCEFLNIDPNLSSSQMVRCNRGWEPRSRIWANHVSPWLRHIPGFRRLEQLNQREGYEDLSHEEYRRAQEIFAPEVESIEEQLGERIPEWHSTRHEVQA